MYAALVSLGDGTEMRWSRVKRAARSKEGQEEGENAFRPPLSRMLP
jgi:hypothetical protein